MDRIWTVSKNNTIKCEMCGKQVAEAVQLSYEIKGEQPILCMPCVYLLKRDLEDLEEDDE